MPKKSGSRSMRRSPELWSRRVSSPRHKLKSGKMSKKKSVCPMGTHKAPGYSKIHSPKRWCVRDCGLWEPARAKGPRGTCKKVANPWVQFLIKYHSANPKRTYKQNMVIAAKKWATMKH